MKNQQTKILTIKFSAGTVTNPSKSIYAQYGRTGTIWAGFFSSPELNDDQINKLSEKLIEFGINASKEIREFGGMPVYAGGDDLLFIAPVVGRDKDGQNMTVFDLIERIDGKCFKSVIESTESLNLRNPVAKPSMSYGIAVTYYKFPLYEALEMAGNLLFGRAKNSKVRTLSHGEY